MKGVVFNIFEDFIVSNFGDDSWEAVLEETNMENDVFVGPKTYEDNIFMTLVAKAVELKNLNLNAAIKLFGKFTFPRLAKKLPSVVAPYSNSKELLLNLDGIIHVEVRKLLEDSSPPKFVVKEMNDGSLDMEYISKRNLYAFVEGLLDGCAEHFNEKITYEKYQCSSDGHCSSKFRIIIE